MPQYSGSCIATLAAATRPSCPPAAASRSPGSTRPGTRRRAHRVATARGRNSTRHTVADRGGHGAPAVSASAANGIAISTLHPSSLARVVQRAPEVHRGLQPRDVPHVHRGPAVAVGADEQEIPHRVQRVDLQLVVQVRVAVRIDEHLEVVLVEDDRVALRVGRPEVGLDHIGREVEIPSSQASLARVGGAARGDHPRCPRSLGPRGRAHAGSSSRPSILGAISAFTQATCRGAQSIAGTGKGSSGSGRDGGEDAHAMRAKRTTGRTATLMLPPLAGPPGDPVPGSRRPRAPAPDRRGPRPTRGPTGTRGSRRGSRRSSSPSSSS
jgi:hypothetical protein